MHGVVADIQGKLAVLITENGEFTTVNNKNYTLGQKVSIEKKTYAKIVSIAASFLLFFILGFGGIKAYNTPVTHVDVDINPSLRLEVNIFDRIVDIIPLNRDAQILIENSEELSGTVNECLLTLTDNASKLGYVNNNNKNVEIFIVSADHDVITDIQEYEKAVAKDVTVEVASVDESTFKIAKEHNISVGKAIAIKEYTDAFGGTFEENYETLKNINKKDIKNMTEETPKQHMADANSKATANEPDNPVTISKPQDTNKNNTDDNKSDNSNNTPNNDKDNEPNNSNSVPNNNKDNKPGNSNSAPNSNKDNEPGNSDSTPNSNKDNKPGNSNSAPNSNKDNKPGNSNNAPNSNKDNKPNNSNSASNSSKDTKPDNPNRANNGTNNKQDKKEKNNPPKDNNSKNTKD